MRAGRTRIQFPPGVGSVDAPVITKFALLFAATLMLILPTAWAKLLHKSREQRRISSLTGEVGQVCL